MGEWVRCRVETWYEGKLLDEYLRRQQVRVELEGDG